MSHSPLLIVGMHRTGTSALGAVLHSWGYSFGDTPLHDDEQNYYEDAHVVGLNDQLLERLGRDWRTPGPLPSGWLDDAQPLLDQAASLILRQRGKWFFKDPRFCLLLPFWRRAFEQTGLEPRILLTQRAPLAVAKSLQRRDKMPLRIGGLLWTTHVLAAFNHSQGLPRLMVDYDTLMDHPDDTMNLLAQFMERSPVEPSAQTIGNGGGLDAQARHHSGASVSTEFDGVSTKLAERVGDLGCGAVPEDLQADLIRFSQDFETQWQQIGTSILDYDQQLRSWEDEFAETDSQLKTVLHALEAQQESVSEHVRVIGDLEQAQTQRERGFKQAVEMVRQRDDELFHLQEKVRYLEARLDVAPPDSDETPEYEEGESVYDTVIDLRVDNNAHTRLIRYVQAAVPEGGRVLEVGCAAGFVGEAIRNLGYEVWGVESSPAAAAIAKQRLDHVVVGTVEEFLDQALFDDTRFSAILFGDVLEHLMDPVRVLRRCRGILDEEGCVIASIPNVAHEAVRLMLLQGRWEYGGYGIMDRTHLKFYTRDTVVDLFSDAGYEVNRMSSIHLPVEDSGINVDPAIRALAAPLIKDREQDVFQFVVMAHATNEPDVREHNKTFQSTFAKHRMLVLPPAVESNLYTIRLADPLTRLTDLYGGEVRVGNMYRLNKEDLQWADTIVLQRETSEFQITLIEQLQAAGKSVVFDLDDYLLDVPEYLSVHEHCKKQRPLLETTLSKVDVVSVSTQPLADLVRVYNDNVHITPNYAWTGEAPISHHASDEPVRLVIASSDTVRVDFLAPALRKIQQSHHVEIVGIGPPGEFLRSLGVEVIALPIMPHTQFKSFLVERNNTVGIIPLDDNEFNRCKSAVKFFDYSLAGVPCICSSVRPYDDVIDDPDNGILVLDNEEAWVQAITVMISDHERRQRTADEARERCDRRHTLDVSAGAWNNLLATLDREPDPLYEWHTEQLGLRRSKLQLLLGTSRHMLRRQSYASVRRLYREEGVAGVIARWRTVF